MTTFKAIVRVVGIKRTTFQVMVELVDEDYRQVHQRRGRRSKLDPEAKVLDSPVF